MCPRPASISLVFAASVVLLALAVVLPWLAAAEDGAAPQVVAAMKGHTEPVYSVAFTPDGKHVVSGSGDSTLKVWDSASGKEIKSLGGLAGDKKLVMSVSISPDGSLIASGGTDNTAKLWDFPSSAPLRALAKSEGANVLAVSPDGSKLVGGDKNGHVKIWNSADGKELFKLEGHRGPVSGLAFSGNGQLLISCGDDKTLRFWEPNNGRSLGVVGAHASAVRGLAVSPNNNAVYTVGADGSLKFWSLPFTASKTLGTARGAVTALALSNDGNSLVWASADKSVQLANTMNGQLIRDFKGANAGVEAAALSPNGALIAAATADKNLLVWQAKDGQLLANVSSQAAGLAFNPGSNHLLTGSSNGTLKLWSMPPAPERALTHPDAVRTAVVSADGKRLFSGGSDRIVRSWNLADARMPERQFSGHTAAINAVAGSADGKLLASAGDEETIRFWDQSNGQEIARIGAHAAAVTSLAFHNDGRLMSASRDGSIKLWQPPTEAKLFAHPGQVSSAVLSTDGSRLLTGCGDKQVRLWNLTDGRIERPFHGPTLGVLCVAMNQAGTQVAAGCADKTLFVWEAATAKEIKKFTLEAAVKSVAFSPDGKLLAGGLANNTIHLFDAAMGKEIKTFKGHSGAINAIYFTSKSDRLVSASADKTVQVWTIADGKSTVKLEHEEAVQALALSKGGTRIAAGADKTVKIWTLTSQTTIATPAAVLSVCFSPEDSRLLVGGADNQARVYGIDGQFIESFAHEGPVNAVAFHGDGKRVLTASADKTVRMRPLSMLWQARHSGPVRQAVFNGKHDRVISCGDDKTIEVWNAADGKLIQSLDAHDNPVAGIAVNADATRIVSCGADKTVKIFTLPAKTDAKEVKPIVLKLPASASAVTLSPNGQNIAVAVAGAKSSRVHVFDTVSGKELLVFAEHGGAISSLSFLADNRTLVSAGADKVVRLSDMNILATVDAHSGGVSGVAFHPNGTQVLSGGADKTVKLWDVAKGQILRTFGPLPEAVRAVAFNRVGTQASAAAGKTAIVWNLADGKEVRKLEHPAEVASLSFSGDGTRLATGASDNKARVWDLASGQELQAFLHGGSIHAVAYHPNNNALVVSASADKTVSLHTMNVTRALSAGTPLNAVAVTANGSHVLTAGEDGKIKLWNANTGANERTLEGGGKGILALAVSKNNLLLAAGGVDRIVRVFTLNDGKLLSAIEAPGVIRHLTFAPNSQTLAAACASAEGASVLQTWNVVFNPGQPLPAEFGKPVQSYADAGAVGSLVFDGKGGTFYSGSADKAIQVWKFATDAPTKNFPHPNIVDVVAFNPAGTQLATGCHDGRVRIFDVAKGTVVREIQAHVTAPQPSAVYCLAWSGDGKQIVSGSYDRSLKLWDAADGKLIREFKKHEDKKFEKGHRDSVICVAIAPDGKTLASGDWDHAIKIWNVADGNVLHDLSNPQLKTGPLPQPPQAHPGVVYGLRYTPDGKHLISAGGAPRLRSYLAIWNVADGKMLYGGEQALGTLLSLALSADGKFVAVGSGVSRLGGEDGNKNNVYVMKLPSK
ncbi:MAG: WD40 domain-containing protein [Gemmataceae bacterium]